MGTYPEAEQCGQVLGTDSSEWPVETVNACGWGLGSPSQHPIKMSLLGMSIDCIQVEFAYSFLLNKTGWMPKLTFSLIFGDGLSPGFAGRPSLWRRLGKLGMLSGRPMAR